MSRKRLLLIGPRVHQVKTGVGVAFELLIEGLQQTDHRVRIVNTQWGGAVRNSGGFDFMRMVVVSTCVLQSWWKLLRCDTLYMPISTSKLGFIRDFLIIRFAALLNVRIVVHLHGSGLKPFYSSVSPSMQKRMQATYSKVDCYIVLGELLRDQFDFVADWEQKTRVVLNGTPIDTSQLDPNLIKQPAAKGQQWRFLFLSNLMPTKGYMELVQACRILAEQGIEQFHCDFCGDFLSTVVENESRSIDQQRTDFLDSLEDSTIKQHVTFHGMVMGDEKIDLLRNCHVFVLATYHPWEGQPLSINEALAWATPVITTKHRGIPEQVIENENGFYVEPRDSGSLAACMRQFIEGETEYETLSENARIHYQQCFTNERHIASLIPLLVDD